MLRTLLSASLSRIATQRIAGAACPCLSFSSKFQSLSLSNLYKPTATTFTYKPLGLGGFSANTSFRFLYKASKASAKIKKKKRKAEKRDRIRNQPKQINPSAAKRARQSVKRRIYNRARITQVKIGVNKVLEALKILKTKTVAQPDEVFAIEKLIEEAHSVIDKAVKIGTLHRKTGARRKSRLARRKKAVELHHGLV